MLRDRRDKLRDLTDLIGRTSQMGDMRIGIACLVHGFRRDPVAVANLPVDLRNGRRQLFRGCGHGFHRGAGLLRACGDGLGISLRRGGRLGQRRRRAGEPVRGRGHGFHHVPDGGFEIPRQRVHPGLAPRGRHLSGCVLFRPQPFIFRQLAFAHLHRAGDISDLAAGVAVRNFHTQVALRQGLHGRFELHDLTDEEQSNACRRGQN